MDNTEQPKAALAIYKHLAGGQKEPANITVMSGAEDGTYGIIQEQGNEHSLNCHRNPGKPDEPFALNGWTIEGLAAVLVAELKRVDAAVPCEQNKSALESAENIIHQMEIRREERGKRGVLQTPRP